MPQSKHAIKVGPPDVSPDLASHTPGVHSGNSKGRFFLGRLAEHRTALPGLVQRAHLRLRRCGKCQCNDVPILSVFYCYEVAQIAEQTGRSKRTIERLLREARGKLHAIFHDPE